MEAAAAIAMSVVAYKTRLLFEKMRGPGAAPAASPEKGQAVPSTGAT